MKILESYYPFMGCDPEFFFVSNGKVLEASKVLSDKGFTVKHQRPLARGIEGVTSRFVIDGVQAELNPKPYSCRANLANEIRECFFKLNEEVIKKQSVGINFSGVIKLSEDEMAQLSETSKKFGCAPSNNVYTGKESEIKVNPATYSYRTAGGHIHIGGCDYLYDSLTTVLHSKSKLFVRLLDLIVGNTCVMLDRDPGQVERRKVYGRAGEYRLPKYGLEYRTLSNFWLQSYPLMSLVFGLVRFAVTIGYNIVTEERESGEESEYRSILRQVKRIDVVRAINRNDFELAKKNFDKIKNLLVEIVGDGNSHYPLYKSNLAQFEYFVKKGIGYWFKQDPLTHWLALNEGHGKGWESFCHQYVEWDMYSEPKIHP